MQGSIEKLDFKVLFTPISCHVINLLIKHRLISLGYFVSCKVVP